MVDFRVDVDPTLERTTKALATYSSLVSDLRPYWRELAERLSDDTQSRWPLRRRSGKLRRSLTWAGSRLGRGGVYKARPDRLVYGSRVFYASWAQRGTRHQSATPLIHVDEADIGKRLDAWTTERARVAGLEVTP